MQRPDSEPGSGSSGAYQPLVELAERAQRIDALRASVEDMHAGKVVPAEHMLADMRKILANKKRAR